LLTYHQVYRKMSSVVADLTCMFSGRLFGLSYEWNDIFVG